MFRSFGLVVVGLAIVPACVSARPLPTEEACQDEAWRLADGVATYRDAVRLWSTDPKPAKTFLLESICRVNVEDGGCRRPGTPRKRGTRNDPAGFASTKPSWDDNLCMQVFTEKFVRKLRTAAVLEGDVGHLTEHDVQDVLDIRPGTAGVPHDVDWDTVYWTTGDLNDVREDIRRNHDALELRRTAAITAARNALTTAAAGPGEILPENEFDEIIQAEGGAGRVIRTAVRDGTNPFVPGDGQLYRQKVKETACIKRITADVLPQPAGSKQKPYERSSPSDIESILGDRFDDVGVKTVRERCGDADSLFADVLTRVRELVTSRRNCRQSVLRRVRNEHRAAAEELLDTDELRTMCKRSDDNVAIPIIADYVTETVALQTVENLTSELTAKAGQSEQILELSDKIQKNEQELENLRKAANDKEQEHEKALGDKEEDLRNARRELAAARTDAQRVANDKNEKEEELRRLASALSDKDREHRRALDDKEHRHQRALGDKDRALGTAQEELSNAEQSKQALQVIIAQLEEELSKAEQIRQALQAIIAQLQQGATQFMPPRR